MKTADVVAYADKLIEVKCQETGLCSKLVPWEMSQKISNVELLNAGSFLPYLTTMEADATLIDFYNSLTINGVIHLDLPDLNHFFGNWLNAEWNEDTLRDTKSVAQTAFSGLFGKQEGGNPLLPGYDSTYSDVHKSGYNKKRIEFLLQRVGFVDIQVKETKGRLVISARKSMNRGERQIATSYKNIRLDHQNRYQFACEYLAKRNANHILDLACGIGYGSLMLAKATRAAVTGVDIDEGAIDYANAYFSGEKVEYKCQDALKLEISDGSVAAIVSFETIEHIDFAEALLSKFNELLKMDGILIASTPNETVMPFDKRKFKYHMRHYTVEEFKNLVSEAGFSVMETYTQLDSKTGEVIAGENGCFTILVCKKVKDVE